MITVKQLIEVIESSNSKSEAARRLEISKQLLAYYLDSKDLKVKTKLFVVKK